MSAGPLPIQNHSKLLTGTVCIVNMTIETEIADLALEYDSLLLKHKIIGVIQVGTNKIIDMSQWVTSNMQLYISSLTSSTQVNIHMIEIQVYKRSFNKKHITFQSSNIISTVGRDISDGKGMIAIPTMKITPVKLLAYIIIY